MLKFMESTFYCAPELFAPVNLVVANEKAQLIDVARLPALSELKAKFLLFVNFSECSIFFRQKNRGDGAVGFGDDVELHVGKGSIAAQESEPRSKLNWFSK